MELLCYDQQVEVIHINRAYEDPVLLRDKCIQNLLALEEKYMPTSNYFKCIQTDMEPYMRQMVATWMLEVCEEQRCEEEVFPLAINYMDRFLCMVNIKRSRLQMLGAACMLIASKFKETIPLTAEKLVIYTDNSITLEQLLDCELLVLQRLKWHLSAATPHDFVEHIMTRLPLSRDNQHVIKRHTQTFISLCCTDFKFAMTPPSMISAGCVAAAIHGLLGSKWMKKHKLLYLIQKIAAIDTECLRSCQEQIEQSVAANLPQVAPSIQKDGHGSETSQPTTPTDVRDVLY